MSHRRQPNQDGVALISAILVGAILVMLSLLLLSFTIRETGQSHRQVRLATASQAAEAGLDDYIAKLTQDHEYYLHYVHPAESPRRTAGGVTVNPGSVWPGGAWTYPTRFTAWRNLANGFQYNLEIKPPGSGSKAVTVTTTGRKTGSTAKEARTFEANVRPATPLDFQRMVNDDLSYGTTATTNGKVYVGLKTGQTRGSTTNSFKLDHPGTARANIYSEGTITGNTNLQNGAKAYNASGVGASPTITGAVATVIKNPIEFNAFTSSLVDVKAAAQFGGGLYVPTDATADGWKVRLLPGTAANNDGKLGVSKCNKSAGKELDVQAPTCGTETLYNVPTNGAVFFEQPVVISGTLDGRVTVVTNTKFIIADATSYENANDDTLGLIAKVDLIIARYVPSVLTWYGAVIVQEKTWQTSPGATAGSKTTMNYYGSATTNLGGSMGMFAVRNYSYDANLQFLQPPYFPVIEDAYTISFFRELTPGV
jgi:hypothetical protein